MIDETTLCRYEKSKLEIRLAAETSPWASPGAEPGAATAPAPDEGAMYAAITTGQIPMI